MIRGHFEFRQTIATVLADDPGHIEAAKAGMLAARREVEDQIGRDPFFAATFEPYIPPNAANTPARMARAAAEAGVGPMAAVAGAIAGAGVEAMAAAGASFGLIDNGGDIALVSDRQVTIGIYAGASPLSGRIAFRVPPQDEILGVCTSSATVGPSISFGIADAVTVFSPDVALADAWATADHGKGHLRPGQTGGFRCCRGACHNRGYGDPLGRSSPGRAGEGGRTADHRRQAAVLASTEFRAPLRCRCRSSRMPQGR